ncbi:MAG: rod shape-determining protein RodA [Candidatus Sumerlaeota bacterium]|nr:rod shape-determining protein RodA [Candidatus Sumerlaeota bacterium]
MVGFEIPISRYWRDFDLTLMALTLALAAYGLVTLFGATIPVPAHAGFAKKQVVWICAGLGLVLVLLFLKSESLEKGLLIFYLAALAALLFLLIHHQHRIKGASSWIPIGPLHLQPSEPAKIAVALLVARVLSRHTPLRGKNLKPGLLKAGAVIFFPFALVAAQPDLGTAAILMFVILAMFWAANIQRRLMTAILLWGILASLVVYPHLKPYQKARIVSFLNPEADVRKAGYQIFQARIAQGSGRIFGKGFGGGTQTEYRFLPEYHNDFIFSSLGEQFGLVGAAAAIALFCAFIARAYALAHRAHDMFGAYAIVGLTSIIAAHVFLNMGMSLGLLPVMGLPLPFFSYGGSFMLTTFTIVGLVLSLRMRRHKF